jgi:hypothetical protein
LFHYESQTRDPKATDIEMTRIRWRWLDQLQSDPYVNELQRGSLAAPGNPFE